MGELNDLPIKANIQAEFCKESIEQNKRSIAKKERQLRFVAANWRKIGPPLDQTYQELLDAKQAYKAAVERAG